MGPPKEVTPSFRNAVKTSPGVPLRGVAASVRMVCVDDFTKKLPERATAVRLNNVRIKNDIDIRHYYDRDMKRRERILDEQDRSTRSISSFLRLFEPQTISPFMGRMASEPGKTALSSMAALAPR